MELKKGMRVTCRIGSTEIKDARIQEEQGSFYICQDKECGFSCKDKLGYRYSWVFDKDSAWLFKIKESNVTDIEDAQEGDIIIKDGYKRKVLGRCGEVVFRSRFDQLDRCDDMVTITQLKNLGYQIEVPQNDTVNIIVEGKTKTISRTSAKELNLID